MSHEIVSRAKLKEKGNWYEDFEPGQVYLHHWGRTISEAENSLFVSLTLNYNPIYTNVEFAKVHGHPKSPINPILVFNVVFGLSVEDLSEHSPAFLGVNQLEYFDWVYPGDTLTAKSTVLTTRPSSSNQSVGIVGWFTEGFNQHQKKICSFERTNLIYKKESP